MLWGEELRGVTLAMHAASGGSRWAKERNSRELKKTKITRTEGIEPIVNMMTHLNEWHKGNNDLFQDDYVFNYGYRPTEHQMKNYLLVLRSYACTQRVADKLLDHTTRTAISYRSKEFPAEGKLFSTHEREIPEDIMAASQMYIFRFPRVVQKKGDEDMTSNIMPTTVSSDIGHIKTSSVEDIVHINTSSVEDIDIACTPTTLATKAVDTTDEDNEDDDKYMLMLVLPTKTPVSAVRLFQELHDITPLGCVLPPHYNIMIKKCGSWRSMQTTPVDNFGQWKHVGMGKDASQNPFLLRCSVGQASTRGVKPSVPVALTGNQRRFHK